MITDDELQRLRACAEKPPLPRTAGKPTAEEVEHCGQWFLTVGVLLPDLVAEVERLRAIVRAFGKDGMLACGKCGLIMKRLPSPDFDHIKAMCCSDCGEPIEY